MLSKEELESSKFFSERYPKERESSFLPTGNDWLASKQQLDQLQDYVDTKEYPSVWRVHDNLYDLSSFNHPGGKDFLDITVGTDVTELFESSHPNIEKARVLLAKYKIPLKKSLPPRNTNRLLFESDGFYCTLRKKVYEALQTLPSPSYWQSTSAVLDALLFGHISLEILSILPAMAPLDQSSTGFPWSYVCAMFSGLLLACVANCAHNFWHMKNNWRMYTWDLTCYSSHEWRITHAYSHHTYPNSILDYEVWAFEPMILFLPSEMKQKIPSFIPILLMIIIFPIGMTFAVSS